MAEKKIYVSDVTKKYLKVLGWLVASWAFGIANFWVKNGMLPSPDSMRLALAPIANFLGFIVITELKKQGYVKALKK